MTEHDLTCRDLIEFLADYVDQSLSAAQRKAFDEHLAICRDCRAYLDAYRHTISLSRAAGRTDGDLAPLPPALLAAIKAARQKGV